MGAEYADTGGGVMSNLNDLPSMKPTASFKAIHALD
jgi:hypothetical protein